MGDRASLGLALREQEGCLLGPSSVRGGSAKEGRCQGENEGQAYSELRGERRGREGNEREKHTDRMTATQSEGEAGAGVQHPLPGPESQCRGPPAHTLPGPTASSSRHPDSCLPLGPISLGIGAQRLFTSLILPAHRAIQKDAKLGHGRVCLHAHTHTHTASWDTQPLGRDWIMERGKGCPFVPLPSLGSSNPHKQLHRGPLTPRMGDKW